MRAVGRLLLALVLSVSLAASAYADPARLVVRVAPLEMVTPVKVARVRRAALGWLALHPESRGLAVRFDVAAERAGQMEVVQDAF